MEHYLRYLSNIIANVIDDPTSVQPVYGIALETRLHMKGAPLVCVSSVQCSAARWRGVARSAAVLCVYACATHT